MKIKSNEKNIWILWYQGEEVAPEVVKRCIASWRKWNQGWNIKVLDKDSLSKYINDKELLEKKNSLEIAHLSDLIRLSLLNDYGGVWVDATCFCNKPLDNWIYKVMDNGYFAFSKPGNDRMISVWFMASTKNSYISHVLYKELKKYFLNNDFKNHKYIKKILEKTLSRNLRCTRIWFSSFVKNTLKVKPYYSIHYMFNKLYSEDEKFKDEVDKMFFISAVAPHRLQEAGMLRLLSPEMKNIIDRNEDPLYKLTYKYDQRTDIAGSNLSYLLKEW